MSDFLYAIRLLTILQTDWINQEAYKHKIIDGTGNTLRKYAELKSKEERDSFTYFHRIVFNLKRMLEKVPGADSKLGKLLVTARLLREGESCDDKDQENDLDEFLAEFDSLIIELCEEVPTNVSGDIAATITTKTPSDKKVLRRDDEVVQ